MVLDTDVHSHVAGSSALQMVQAAKARGLRVLGLSEHVFQMSEARPLLEHMPLEGPLRPFTSYTNSVRQAALDTTFDVRLGLEVDYIPEQQTQIQALLQPYDWDYLIGSVHQIDDLLFENVEMPQREEGEQRWFRYMALLRAAVTSNLFNVVSHPVRLRVKDPFLPPTLDSELEHLAAEATRHNVALEVNGFDLLYYPTVVQRLVKACALQKTPISVGSDAHMPRQIARAHAQTTQILKEAGINTVRIWRQRQIEEYVF